MKHYVLTRSAYGPAWDREANARRLEITRAVTARLMAQQTTKAWTWVVLLDERDPLKAERLALYQASAPAVIPIWRNGEVEAPTATIARQRSAAADYKAPWRSMFPADDQVLMTRIDDDDGFAIDALARYQQAARKCRGRTALMMPMGMRVWAGRYSMVRHERNAMHTLVTPPGDEMCIYDYSHVKVRQSVRVQRVDARLGWLWVRHQDTISGWKQANRPITAGVRSLFPVDWAALSAAWR